MKSTSTVSWAGSQTPLLLASLSMLLLWLTQPPLAIATLVVVALVPLLFLIERPTASPGREALVIWGAGTVYWLFTLQGLRHAHVAMYACWFALAMYLAAYLPLTVWISRRLTSLHLPLAVAFPLAWVGLECVRNYFLTGISAVMLGHSLADVPIMIQIADLTGTYGVSFVVAAVNVALFLLIRIYRNRAVYESARWQLAAIGVLVGATFAYGWFRLHQAEGEALATFALIQRDEAVEYVQDADREIEIVRLYAEQSVAAAAAATEPIDAVVWPESMFTGGVPWYVASDDVVVPAALNMTREEFDQMILGGQSYVSQRALTLQALMLSAAGAGNPPHLIAGSSVIRYDARPEIYSAVIHILPGGQFGDWYGKSHLVLFGEYVPLVRFVPPLRARLPNGMGINVGPGPKTFAVGETTVSPNICIETAVERVTINQLATLRRQDKSPDVVVTVTNDGWFDESSVLEHHLRCAQLVAVGGRRPILSAANSGPTAWIDSAGRIVERLPVGTNGSIIATPRRDSRTSLYVLIGDWPARLLALVCLAVMIHGVWLRWRAWRTG